MAHPAFSLHQGAPSRRPAPWSLDLSLPAQTTLGIRIEAVIGQSDEFTYDACIGSSDACSGSAIALGTGCMAFPEAVAPGRGRSVLASVCPQWRPCPRRNSEGNGLKGAVRAQLLEDVLNVCTNSIYRQM